jgi:tRNA G46 methylase TrmB
MRVEIEIGAGNGLAAIARAKLCPDVFTVAIEQTRTRFAAFERNFRAAGAPANLLPVHANAIPWVTAEVPLSRVSKIWILYPNPSPKNPSGRWIRMPFFSRLIDCLVPAGEIHLATNLPFYADEVRRFARDHWELSVEAWIPSLSRTAFEEKYLAAREPCQELVLRKGRSGNS